MYNDALTFDLGLDAHSPPSSSKISTPARWAPARTSPVFDIYWYFAAERQAIFFRKLLEQPAPWTNDTILAKYKFTNAYRASDRVSQYLIRNVIYKGDQSSDEVFFRTILFKTFNKIETWELLTEKLGSISYDDFAPSRYAAILSSAMAAGRSIYSAAYIMPSGNSAFGKPRKHQNHLELIKKMMDESLPDKLGAADSMSQVFDLFLSYPMIGDFLAYQYAIDINYSELTNFNESEFVVPGPGALDGIRKCFVSTGGLNEIDIIKLMMERQDAEFARLGITFPSLFGRPLQLIDCQNLFCEVSKYSRVSHPEVQGISGRVRIKQQYSPIPRNIDYWYPPKWGLNKMIEQLQKKTIPRRSKSAVEIRDHNTKRRP